MARKYDITKTKYATRNKAKNSPNSSRIFHLKTRLIS